MTEEAPKKRKGLGTAAIALVTAVVALVSGGVGLTFDVFPGLRPDPRNTRSASVKVLQVELEVTLGDWLKRTATSEERRRREQDAAVRATRLDPRNPEHVKEALGRTGTVFFVETTVEGLKRDRVALRWSIYEKRGRMRVADHRLHDVEALSFKLNAPTDRSVVQVWTPYPGGDAQPPYFARFELRDRVGVALAIADSDAFSPPALDS